MNKGRLKWFIHTLSLPYSYTGETMGFVFAISFIVLFILAIIMIFVLLKYYKPDLDDTIDEFSKITPK